MSTASAEGKVEEAGSVARSHTVQDLPSLSKEQIERASYDDLIALLMEAIQKTAEIERRISSILREAGMEDEWRRIVRKSKYPF